MVRSPKRTKPHKPLFSWDSRHRPNARCLYSLGPSQKRKNTRQHLAINVLLGLHQRTGHQHVVSAGSRYFQPFMPALPSNQLKIGIRRAGKRSEIVGSVEMHRGSGGRSVTGRTTSRTVGWVAVGWLVGWKVGW